MAEILYERALDLPLRQLSRYPYDLPRALAPLAHRPVRELRDEDFAELLRRRCFVEVSVRLLARRVEAAPLGEALHRTDDEASWRHAAMLRELVLLDEQAWQLDPAALRVFQAYLRKRLLLALPRYVRERFAALTPGPLRWTDKDFETYEMSKAYGGLSGGTAAQEDVRRLKVALNNGVPIEYAARGRAVTITTEPQLIEHVVREIAGEIDPEADDDFDQGLYSIIAQVRKIV